ncbi:unnamed protein product, partial [Leptidea sinapis]
MEFIDEFRNEIEGYNYTVDLYGPCGDKRCPGKSMQSCHNLIEKSYHFQLVVEETFAADYVTEKMVRVMNTLAIPILLGGSNYR